MAQWKANGCKPPSAAPDLTVVERIERFWIRAKTYYVDRRGKRTTSLDNDRAALRPVVRLYGSTPFNDFGPIALKAVRQTTIEQDWSRTHINKQVRLIKSVFDWRVSEQLFPSSVAEALKYVKGLPATGASAAAACRGQEAREEQTQRDQCRVPQASVREEVG